MKTAQLDTTHYLIRLEKGEEVVASLKAFCTSQTIKNASVSALGSVENPTLAHYRVENKQYTEKTLEGIFELLNLTGNIAVFEDNSLPHLHVSFSDDQMHAFGGHLVTALVSATVEIILTVFPTKYEKKLDEAIGLKLFNLPAIE